MIKNSIALSTLVLFIVTVELISLSALLLNEEILFWEKLRIAGIIDLSVLNNWQVVSNFMSSYCIFSNFIMNICPNVIYART